MDDKTVHPDDSVIVAQVLRGDVNAFESLLVRHKALVLKIVSKHVPHQEVEETAQDVFVRAFQSLSSFEGRAGFDRWLSSIAVRTCYDYWRRAYRSREVPLTMLTEKHRSGWRRPFPGNRWRRFVRANPKKRPESFSTGVFPGSLPKTGWSSRCFTWKGSR